MISKTLSDAARRSLRYVQVPDGSVDLTRFPDFLIVGPQRTGTTWIHRNFRDHPDVLWPRNKEVYYFNRLTERDHARFKTADIRWYLDHFRDTPRWWFVKQAMSLRSCGRLYRPKVSGEATASYAALEPAVIDDIVLLNPEIRAVVMLRNPVERAWSHAKKDLVRNRGRRFDDVADAEFQAFFSDDYQLRCANYVENIDNWTSRLAPGHVFVGRFDDIAERPAPFLGEIADFLRIDSSPRMFGGLVEEPVNPTGKQEMPQHHREFLEKLLAVYLDDIDRKLGIRWE